MKLSVEANLYTCQLFLRYKREIFILGVLGFLKMTQSFPKIPEEVRSFQSGVRNWPAGVSRREIEVFNLQAWGVSETKT